MQQLDDSQRAFCEAPGNDNIRLLAPAGCGKTLCLLHRCKYLASQKPDKKIRFLIVTFTRAAEQELSARLSDDPEFASLKESVGKTSVEVNTLNAWGWRRLRNKVPTYTLIESYESYECNMAMVSVLADIWNSHKHVKGAVENKKVKKKILMKIIDRFKTLGFDHTHHTNFTEFLDHLNALYEQNLRLILKEQFDDLFKCRILDKHRILNASDSFKDFNNRQLRESLFEYMILTIKGNTEGNPLIKQFREILAEQCYDSFFRFWIQACCELKKKNIFTLTDQKYISLIENNIGDTKFLSGNPIYDYVFVDEFQDINPLDLNLVKAIAKSN